MEDKTQQERVSELIEAKIAYDQAKEWYDRVSKKVKENDTWFDNGRIEKSGIIIKMQSRSKWVVNEKVTPLEVLRISPNLVKIDATKLAKINPEMCHKEHDSTALVFEGLGKGVM